MRPSEPCDDSGLCIDKPTRYTCGQSLRAEGNPCSTWGRAQVEAGMGEGWQNADHYGGTIPRLSRGMGRLARKE